MQPWASLVVHMTAQQGYEFPFVLVLVLVIVIDDFDPFAIVDSS
jgi:hypothetical protein